MERRVAGALVKTFLFRRRKGKAWAFPPHYDVVPVRFAGNNGARIAGHHVRHPHPHGLVVLAHPDRRYGQFWFVKSGWIDLLLDAGYEALTFDFSQYGASRGGSAYLHDDLAGAVAEARRLRPGLPLHVVGVSIGAFAAANAAPRLDGVESLLLESPYPSFTAWYEGTGASGRALNALFARLFPTTYRRIDAAANIRHAPVRRLLIAAAVDDHITPTGLSRAVAVAAPAGRTTYLELRGVQHLDLLADPAYREAIVAHLAGRPVAGIDATHLATSRPIPTAAASAANVPARGPPRAGRAPAASSNQVDLSPLPPVEL